MPCRNRKRHLIELPSPFAREPGTLRVLAPPEGFSSEQLDRLRVGATDRPFIIDYGGVRNLFFTADSIQSAMRLDEPDALITPYTRKMMAFLLLSPTPRHVLMIGLGGGSLAKFCYRQLPRTRICVVESNADVIALRDEFAIPPDEDRFQVIHDDGASFLANSNVSPDIILIDAFDELGVSPSLLSSHFYDCASRCLPPEGVLVMNLSGEKSRYVTHLEALRAAFTGSIRLVQVEGEDNVLVFACREPDLADLPAFLYRRAAHLERALGLEFCRYLERLRAGPLLDANPHGHPGTTAAI
jgi:spermidine synthase